MESKVKPRPAVLRALGASEPPAVVSVDGNTYQLEEIFKHDSWAATALYAGVSGNAGANEKVVCKFNRVQSIYGLPTRPLGRLLARRENFAYHELQGIAGIIAGCGPVFAEGKCLPNAVAHRYLPGHPLGSQEEVDDQFFPALLQTLQEVHSRGFAYVDLHKRENILVSETGKPFLIDFQISYHASPQSLFSPVSQRLLKLLQQSDLYHFSKHVKRLRPDHLESLGLTQISQRPWWIRLHRLIAVPFRETRRWLLTQMKVRGKSGRSASEAFAEHAFRCEQKKAA